MEPNVVGPETDEAMIVGTAAMLPTKLRQMSRPS